MDRVRRSSSYPEPMNYHILLTGATGLLGRYLVRDLILADVPVAVVVRRSRRMTAQERMDAVMATWEERMGRELPSPKVLEGDLTEEHLGLNDADVEWVRENCDAVLHNAASLTFVSTDPEGEPWRSNVKGTQNVLDLCEKTGIKDFHHVSTSYVCGLRSDTVKETELDVGQTLGYKIAHPLGRIAGQHLLEFGDAKISMAADLALVRLLHSGDEAQH